MSNTKVVSFAKPGSGSAPVNVAPAPATSASPAPADTAVPVANATPVNEVPQAAAPANLPAVQAPSTLANTQGAEEEGDVAPGDIKLPKLKLLQGTSDKKLLATHGFGTLLFKDSIAIAKPAVDGAPGKVGRLVFVKLLSKSYTEKVAKYGDPSMFARSLAEVEEMGGTADWRLSKENKKANSTKPWFQVNANCLVLVEKPEGADDDHFPIEVNGKFYAPALYTVKSFAYDRFYVEIATAKATGELRKGGWSSRFIDVSVDIEQGKGNAEFAVPSVRFGEATPEELRTVAAEF